MLKTPLVLSLVLSSFALSGCMGSAGGLASAAAQSAASGAITSGTNRARFQRQSCDQLEQEVLSAQRAIINPLAIPSTQAYIRDARAVATEKGCSFVTDA